MTPFENTQTDSPDDTPVPTIVRDETVHTVFSSRVFELLTQLHVRCLYFASLNFSHPIFLMT